jgi:nucleotide-binding universal stress UspA family protein
MDLRELDDRRPAREGTLMYQRIIVPLDGSALAERALPLAEGLARLTGAPLHLVRVIDPTERGAPRDPDLRAYQIWLEDERIAARNDLERVETASLARQQRVTVEYRFGPAAREILATVRPDDLIVMATHGRGGPARWYLGSVAEEVARQTTVPVLLVRAGHAEAGPAAIRRLVVPLDGSPLAEEAVPTALALAQRLHAPVHLLTVIDTATALPLTLAAATVSAERFAETVAQLFAEAEALLAAPRDRLEAEGVATSTAVLHGSPGPAIVEVVQPGDLIVMTSHGRGGIQRWLLGSVAETLIRQAPVPVLLVRTPPPTPAHPASGAVD